MSNNDATDTSDIQARLAAMGFVPDDSDHISVRFVGPKGAAAARRLAERLRPEGEPESRPVEEDGPDPPPYWNLRFHPSHPARLAKRSRRSGSRSPLGRDPREDLTTKPNSRRRRLAGPSRRAESNVSPASGSLRLHRWRLGVPGLSALQPRHARRGP